MRLGPNEGVEVELLGARAGKGLVAVAASKSFEGHMQGVAWTSEIFTNHDLEFLEGAGFNI